MDTNITKTWSIDISEAEVFARCVNESLYQAYNRTEVNPKDDAIVIQEDDYGQFHRYFGVAIANLEILLARRMDMAAFYSGTEGERTVSFSLNMHDNHSDVMLNILITHCYEYIVKQILEQWYHVDFGSALERLEINHCLHYRKNPVRRRFDPLI